MNVIANFHWLFCGIEPIKSKFHNETNMAASLGIVLQMHMTAGKAPQHVLDDENW